MKPSLSKYEERYDLTTLLESNHYESLKSLCGLLLREIELLATIKIETENSIFDRETISLDEEVERFEANLIKSALYRAGGNQSQAARLLGVKHTTLNAKIKRYKIAVAESVNYSIG